MKYEKCLHSCTGKDKARAC